jgi:hypothetical protein
MKSIAASAIKCWAAALTTLVFVTGCSNMSTSVGISFPIGPFGSIGVGVDSNGRVGGSVGVGVGPATVSVGTSGQLPASAPKADDKPAEKAPAQP